MGHPYEPTLPLLSAVNEALGCSLTVHLANPSMNPVAPFLITTLTSPSGDAVSRVFGWLDGKRVRKNFPTHAEADAERQIPVG